MHNNKYKNVGKYLYIFNIIDTLDFRERGE